MRFRLHLLVVSLVLYLGPSPASAFLKLGSDFFFSGLIETSFRTHNYLFLDLGSVSFGPVVGYEPLHSYLTDLSYGGGIRLGHTIYFEIDLGLLQRTFHGISAGGFAGNFIVGFTFTKNLSVAFPIIVKRIVFGLDPRTSLDLMPYFGLRLEL